MDTMTAAEIKKSLLEFLSTLFGYQEGNVLVEEIQTDWSDQWDTMHYRGQLVVKICRPIGDVEVKLESVNQSSVFSGSFVYVVPFNFSSAIMLLL